MDEEDLQSLQHKVFSGTISHPNLAKTVRELKREVTSAEFNEYTDIKQALSAAKRLLSALEHVPEDLRHKVELESFMRAAAHALELMEPQSDTDQSNPNT